MSDITIEVRIKIVTPDREVPPGGQPMAREYVVECLERVAESIANRANRGSTLIDGDDRTHADWELIPYYRARLY